MSAPGTILATHHTEQSLEGSPDSILSGPLEEGGNSAPDSAESVAPTAPFPPITNTPILTFSLLDSEKELFRRNGTERKTKNEQRAFGSPVSIDEHDARF